MSEIIYRAGSNPSLPPPPSNIDDSENDTEIKTKPKPTLLDALDVLLSSDESTLNPLQRQQLVKERNRIAATMPQNPTLPVPKGDGAVSDPKAAVKVFGDTSEFFDLITAFSQKFQDEFGYKIINDASQIISLIEKLSSEEFVASLTLEDFYEIPPDPQTLALQKKFIKEIEEEFLREVRAGRLQTASGHPISEANLFLKGTYLTTISIVLMECMAQQKEQAFKEAMASTEFRNVVFDLVKQQVAAIIEEGRLQAEQYKEIGYSRLIGACISAGLTVSSTITSRIVAAKAYPTHRTNANGDPIRGTAPLDANGVPTGKGPLIPLGGAELESARRGQEATLRSWQSVSESLEKTNHQAVEAAVSLIQAKFAPLLKNTEADQFIKKQMIETATGQQQDRARIAQDSRDSVLKLLNEMFASLWQSGTRNVSLDHR